MGIGNLLLVPEADYNLLGRDLIIEMGINIEVVNEEIKIKLCPLRVEDEEKINSEVWYTPDSVGRLNIPPFSVIIKDPETPIRVKQYPISPEGKNGLKPEIERLLSKGLLESCMSPFDTPILPIKKADGSYRLVHDLREINKRTVARFPVVANPYTLLSRLGPEKQYYSVIDLKDAFWACPLDEKSRDYFAFEWEDPVTHRRQQLRWTVLPQGFTESPNLFGQALEQILQEYQTGEGVTLIQYVDDLLIAGETEDKVRAESIRLLNFLSAKGLKVSKAKTTIRRRRTEIVDCTCRTRLKGIRCDTPRLSIGTGIPMSRGNRVAPGDLLKNIPAAEKMVPPMARGNRVDGKGRRVKKLWRKETPGVGQQNNIEELPQE
ncbi:hypothetical protein DUI87_26052 [Hirundo rustica rustica]|uniref:ribonuclease H n=1 Tax=Hirundo rustica rustica TaxID=333673 RepID=A0A3M0J840_HIRRU|nr:hypothetical protein DUI87_26052 [Hirundo rustica rustica]